MSHEDDPRILVVAGATGGQGGGIIDVLLDDPPFPIHIRGLTRDTTSQASQDLIARGVEMFQVDFYSEDSLWEAFLGAFAIFAVTDYWEHFARDPSNPRAAQEYEIRCGQNLARAAARVRTLEHYIWSTTPYMQRLSPDHGVSHFEGKALVDDFIRHEFDHSLYMKTTFLWVAFYARNVQRVPMWKPRFDKTVDRYVVDVPVDPETRFESVGSLRNVGLAVSAIIQWKGGWNLVPEGGTLPPPTYVLVTIGAYSLATYYETWARVALASPEAKSTKIEVRHLNAREYDEKYGAFGREMRVMFEFWEEYRDDAWKMPPLPYGRPSEGEMVLLDTYLLSRTAGPVIDLEESFQELTWDV